MELFDEIHEFLQTAKPDDFEALKMDNILTSVEIQKIILALAEKRGDTGFTEDEAAEIILWAESVRLQETLLDLVLKGLSTVDLNSEGEPVFSLTEKGAFVAENISQVD